jgi:sec-independent protein translocase protein TatC
MITLFVAGFTPSPDPLSMIALALPLIALYFLAGLISLANDRRREKKALRADSGD